MAASLYKGEVVWFRPALAMQGGALKQFEVVGSGNPTKNEAIARKQATRIGKALLSAGISAPWSVGIIRSFNRSSSAGGSSWSENHGTKPDPLPPLPEL